MNKCSRCQRYHSDRLPCSIPLGTTIYLVRIGIGEISKTLGKKEFNSKPKPTKLGVDVLKNMLVQTHAQVKKVTNMMKTIPLSLPEFDQLIDRSDKLEKLILQLNLQIIERESK